MHNKNVKRNGYILIVPLGYCHQNVVNAANIMLNNAFTIKFKTIMYFIDTNANTAPICYTNGI